MGTSSPAYPVVWRAFMTCKGACHKGPPKQWYPRGLGDRNWGPTLQPPPSEQDTLTATVTFPYICHLSETSWRILAPLRIHINLLPTILHPKARISQVEGPKPPGTMSQCHLLNSLWYLLESVHWPNGYIGHWNMAWRNTGGHWHRETLPSQRRQNM